MAPAARRLRCRESRPCGAWGTAGTERRILGRASPECAAEKETTNMLQWRRTECRHPAATGCMPRRKDRTQAIGLTLDLRRCWDRCCGRYQDQDQDKDG